jgi:hypothetical protein
VAAHEPFELAPVAAAHHSQVEQMTELVEEDGA